MPPLKRKLTFVVVVVAVAACAAGAYAATQASSSSPRQAFFNDVAHRLHVTPAQLKKAMQGAFADRLSALVASGRITKAQASAIEKRLASSGRYPGLGMFGLGGFGRGMHRGFGPGWFAYPPVPGVPAVPGVPRAKLPPNARPGPGGKLPKAAFPPGLAVPVPVPRAAPFPLFGPPAFGFLLPGGMKAARSYLGLRPAQLKAQLRAGRSLAQIAEARGKSVKGLESAIESALRARLNRQVAAKHLTRAQASRILSAVDANVAAWMHVKLARARFRAYHLHGLRRFGLIPHRSSARLPTAVLAPA